MSASTRLRGKWRGGGNQPPLCSRLAVAFFCLTFGSFLWIWLALVYAACLYPSVVIPGILAWGLYITVVDGDAMYVGWAPRCRNLPLWTRHMRSYFASAAAECRFRDDGGDGDGDGDDGEGGEDGDDGEDGCDDDGNDGSGPGKITGGESGAARGDGTVRGRGKAPTMFMYHPHGVLAIGAWMGLGCNALGLDDMLGGRPPRLVTLNINFFAPFLREFLLMHGVCSCSRRAILSLLRRGENVGLVVGGSSESLLSRRGPVCDLVLRRRRGYARIALETGCNLVPVVGFGENELYSTWNEWRVVQWIQRRIGRTLGFTIPIAMGRGLILPWGLLPYSRPLRVVTGRSVPVARYDGPTDGPAYERLVEEVKRRYERALIELFESQGVTARIVE
jgi:hypothetical protein